MNTCKQTTEAKVLHCPKFRKKLSEDEFQNLIREIDSMEERTAELSRRVKSLIEKALSGKTESEENHGN
jgi:hypothetical protein